MNNNNISLRTLNKALIGIQFLFVAFGATVLVPLLIGIDPAIALFTAGVGTLIFHLVTKGKVPVFLGSSFAFIAPIIEATKLYGYPGTLSGLVAVGLVYIIISVIIRRRGLAIIEKLFPSVVVGPVIMIIGLSLAATGVEMASKNWLIAIVSLSVAILAVTYTKGIIKLIPVLMGILIGYVASIIIGIVDFSPILDAPWIGIPEFVIPEFSWVAIVYLIPVAMAPIIEHVGDIYAISGVTGDNFIKNPGLHKTLLGDGLATSFAGFFGGPPNTTYSEVTGAVALTKITDPAVMRIAAVSAIIFSLIGKLSGLLRSIPEAVLGGIMLLLFGMIASVGIQTLVKSQTDMLKTRNQVIVSVILTVGIGGAVINYGNFNLSGIGLASVIGIVLNLILPEKTKPLK